MSFFLVALLASLPVWTLEVRVVDAEGQPIEAVRVEQRWPSRSVGLESDFDGRLLLSTWPAGRARATFTKEGWRSLEASLGLRDRDLRRPVDLVLERAFRFEGWVVAESGAPIEGAAVFAREEKRRGTFGTILSEPKETPVAHSDEHGYFAFEAVAEGEIFVLEVRAEDFVARRVDARAVGEPVEIALVEAARIRGRVAVSEGEVGWTRLALHREDERAPFGWADQVADAEGLFEFEGLPAGTWAVEAQAPGFEPYRSSSIVLEPGDHGEIEVDLEPGASFSGRVLSRDGEPVPGTRIQLHAPLDSRRHERLGARTLLSWQTSTDASGRFTIEGLPPGDWTVEVFHPEHHRFTRPLVLARAEEREIELRFPTLDRHTVTLRLVDLDGAPLPGASCSLSTDGIHVPRNVEGGDSGVCVLEDVPEGEFRVGLHRSGWVSYDPNRRLRVDGPIDLVVPMSPSVDLRGEIRGLTEEEMRSLEVRATLEGRFPSVFNAIVLVPQDEYRFPALPHGVWRIEASLLDGRSISVRTEVFEGVATGEAIDFLEIPGAKE